MKKILILGGTAQQIKLVEAAKKMGEINKKWVSYREKAIKAKVK